MPGRARPSFLKRQKEQKRAQRATEKRAAQQARRDRRAAGLDPINDDGVLDGRDEPGSGEPAEEAGPTNNAEPEERSEPA